MLADCESFDGVNLFHFNPLIVRLYVRMHKQKLFCLAFSALKP